MYICTRTSWVKTNGQLYKPLNAVIMGIDDDLPQFGVIKNIYITDCNTLLEVEIYKTISFLHHYHGYDVKVISQTNIINISSLVSPYSLLINHLAHINKSVVVLKYHVCNTIF